MAGVFISISKEAEVRATEKLRGDVCRRILVDEELESLEKELRRDLFQRGSHLFSDSTAACTSLKNDASSIVVDPCHKLMPTQAPLAVAENIDESGVVRACEAEDSAARDMPATVLMSSGAETELGTRWRIQSQQPWRLGKEHCTLTTFEDSADGMIQFQLLKHSTGETTHLTCKNSQFDDMCKAQTGISGTAQVSAAISQLFREFVEWPSACAPNAGAKPGTQIDASAKVGEVRSAPRAVSPRVGASSDQSWRIQSQQPWLLGTKECTLTVMENADGGMMLFELLKLSNRSAIYAMCTKTQFSLLCDEQAEFFGTAQKSQEVHDDMSASALVGLRHAAIRKMFQEVHETSP